METGWYARLCTLVDQVCPHGRRARQQFADAAVLKLYLWAVLHDRPVSWACRPGGCGPPPRWQGPLPSQSTLSRRLRTVGVISALERLLDLLAGRFPGGPLKQIDAKPLIVGNYSKDRDARRGRAAGAMARGYKLHALRDGGILRHWTLTSLNVNDQVPAPELLGRLGRTPGAWGYVTGDNQYDANPVHAAAAAAGHQLIAPPRRANAEVRDARRNTAARLRSLELCAHPLRACGLARPSFGQELLAERGQIERAFGHLAQLGLFAPPPWVRRPHRVALWIAAKLAIQMTRLLQLRQQAA